MKFSASTLFFLVGLSVPISSTSIQQDGTSCTANPLGNGQDDVPNILTAVSQCGQTPGGRVVLPAPYTYRINQRMTTHLANSRLEIGGTLLFSDDIDYWVNNSYRVDFQNQSSAWRITGHDYVIDGGPHQGGIDGNGQLWYTWAKGGSNVFGRPIPLHVFQLTRATLRNLSIRQPQFWAVLVDSSSHIALDHVYVNATNHDFSVSPEGEWVQNTDGVDTYRSDYISITNWVYQGGDDAVAFKGNSTNTHVENVTVYGGPGIAFGSLGQYPDRADIVEIITVKNVQPSFKREMDSGVYFKSWIGVNYGVPPNGGGGGTGYVRNVTVENIQLKEVQLPVYIDTCLSYLFNENVTQYCDTSTYKFEDLHFKNISGNGLATVTDYPGKNITFAVSLLCSDQAPCMDLTFQNIDITLPVNYTGEKVLCKNAEVKGLQCNS
ncbi:exopolygalacturonase A [Aspergillus sclerotioniger CBS 115572]|uniref:galacturonan 1,4-alpha-galacturonidase n=1 Tax=Aspergillus sclerotioniger CBS 115572 TaxID=1450535 RepID=A0A317WR03_9EURO|nr:exopolygalacturonase A [Aspergillus sclerotioniger CBS 115572]PWY88846.1 exopolygalacturonase A [Aspergillus sclerotioniger CBS 115572]